MIRHYGLLNLGRDKKPGSTDRIDRAALVRLLEKVGDKQAAVFGVEINEGDDNNELALFRQVFRGWREYSGHSLRRVREPIFLSPDQPRAHWRVDWISDTSVKHWSPLRSVMRVRLADEPTTLIAVHYAAGPHTAGERPPQYRAPLHQSWDLTHVAHMAAKRDEHQAGRHVTEAFDANHYSLPGLPGEVTAFHERTDYGRAYPAHGYRAEFRDGGAWSAGLDSHGIHVMHGTYRKEKS